LQVKHGCDLSQRKVSADDLFDWAEAHIKIARMTLTIKLDRNWSSFQLANSANKRDNTASTLGLGAVNAQTAPLVLNSFRSRSLANQTHDHRDWG
jgi:hypothetical protein